MTERVNRKWMSGAFNYKNNPRGRSGKENFETKWFRDLNAMDWTIPFFRHVDGKDHTHFFIDIDVRVVDKRVKTEYRKYPEKLRALKIEAAMEYFRKWQMNYAHHKFFWKIGGTGLHAIQRIDRRIDRSRLTKILLFLFPPTKKIEVEISDPKNAIHVKPPENGRNHFPLVNDDGWCLDYDFKQKRYITWNWVRLWEYKGIVYKFVIDLNFFLKTAQVVRWTYSPYFNIPGRIYYSVPIKSWKPKEVLANSVRENLLIEPYEIPEFSFRDMIDWEDTVEDELWIQRVAKSSSEPKNIIPAYQIHIYNPEEVLPDRYARKLDNMSSMFNPDVNKCPPCIYEHYRRACTRGGSHWARFQVSRYLRAFNYSIEDIANWMRFKVNDEKDNLPQNRHSLLQFLPHVLGPEDDPHKVASCGVLQDPGSNFYVCDEKMQQFCGRSHPLARRPILKEIKPVGKVEVEKKYKGRNERRNYWIAIKELVREAFSLNENLVVWKATRAGVTTSMIRIATEMGKKLLVVVPTNRISEITFPDALKIVKEDTNEVVNGAILASNRKGCLLLNFVERQLEIEKQESPDWGDSGIAWRKLRYHSRPDCLRCRYSRATINTPITNKEGFPEPLNHSQILDFDRRTGYCAYQTFQQQLENFDVVFVTYSKLYSLMLSSSEDSEALRDDLYSYFDVIMLDEVSTFANKSPMDMSVLRNPTLITKMNESTKIDVFAQLRAEIINLSQFTTSKVANTMVQYTQRFIAGFEHLKLRQWDDRQPTISLVQEFDDDDMNVIPHPLSYYERQELKMEFNKIHGILDRYTQIENKHLNYMEDILLLLCEDSWVAVNTPSPVRRLDLRFVSAPKTAEVKAFVRQFGRQTNDKVVFATDACMPEVNMSEFFDLGFKDFIVGDPRQTNEQQLIIADTRQIGVLRFMRAGKCLEYSCPHWEHNKCTLVHKYIGKDPHDNYKEKIINYRALYKDKCRRYQVEFIKECSAIAKMYGPENVMIVLPNMDIYFWLLNRIKWGAIAKGVEVTYYRSDKTVGVPCDRRIMICLSMPFSPKGSHLWLAHYYQRDNLLKQYSLTDLAGKLRLNACKQAFWQTIGRAKSPVGKTRSVVIAWGISDRGISTLFDFNKKYMKDSLPKVFYPRKTGHDERTTYKVGRFWRTYGAVPEGALIRLMHLANSAKWIGDWVKHSDIKRYGGIVQEEIEKIASLYDEEMFGHLGLEVETSMWGANTTIKARSINSKETGSEDRLIKE